VNASANEESGESESSTAVKRKSATITSLSSPFSPQKKLKGYIYYQDRVNELQENPTLAFYSQVSPTKEKILMKAMKVEDTQTDYQSDSFPLLDGKQAVLAKVFVKSEASLLIQDHGRTIGVEEEPRQIATKSSRKIVRSATK
jgi:hypothetical protein